MQGSVWGSIIRYILGLYRDNGKENGNDCIGIMEKRMETILLEGMYQGYIGIMEKKVET